jgi:hypothetical protein
VSFDPTSVPQFEREKKEMLFEVAPQEADDKSVDADEEKSNCVKCLQVLDRATNSGKAKNGTK